MRRTGLLVVFSLLLAASAPAADFDWTRGFNQRVQADPAAFRASLAARFRVGDTQITAVLGNVASPADAYIVLRLGEISRQPADRVLGEYKTSRGRGWGVIAKSLGIKPGSAEFQALKKGQDLFDDGRGKGGENRGKGKGKKRR